MHASVRMLSRDSGLIDAMAYGARSRRGSLRGSVVPFASGRCYLYTDPAKGHAKITDLAVETYYPELRENIKKFYVATLWAEVVLASYAAGSEGEAVWGLLTGCLRLLAAGTEAEADRVNLQFLWRFVALLGMRPELPQELSGRYRYSSGEHRFRRWDGGEQSEGHSEPVSAGALAYLRASGQRAIEEATSVSPTSDQTRELKRFLFRLIQDSAERELRTLKSGQGIL